MHIRNATGRANGGRSTVVNEEKAGCRASNARRCMPARRSSAAPLIMRDPCDGTARRGGWAGERVCAKSVVEWEWEGACINDEERASERLRHHR